MLGRALSKKNELDDVTAARHALLWSRLASARLERGDKKGARAACESAIDLAPDCDGAVIARRKLLDILEEDESAREQLLEYRRFLAADTHDPRDIIDYGRALAASDQIDGARIVLQLAEWQGQELSDSDLAIIDDRRPKRLADDESYEGQITAEERAELFDDPGHAVTRRALELVWEAAPNAVLEHGRGAQSLGSQRCTANPGHHQSRGGYIIQLGRVRLGHPTHAVLRLTARGRTGH